MAAVGLLLLLPWVVGFSSSVALVAASVYILMGLTDLENDFVNPHDLARNVNWLAVPEMALHTAVSLLLLLSGHWVSLLLNVPLLAYHCRILSRNEHVVDVTEAFKQVDAMQRSRMMRLVFYLSLMVYTMLRLVFAALQ